MEFTQVQVTKEVYTSVSDGWYLRDISHFTMRVEEYKRFISAPTLNWFRNLGSAQHTKHKLTSFGWQCVKLVSVSPDESEKHEYNFSFIN